MNRRHFLNSLLSIGAVGTVVAALVPVFDYLKPLPRAVGNALVRLTRTQVAALRGKSRSTIVRSETKKVIVFDDDSSRVHALNAVCTHEGCLVQYLPEQGIIWCACHNGRYDLDDRVISGPPPKPLAQYAVKTDDAGEITIDTGHAI